MNDPSALNRESHTLIPTAIEGREREFFCVCVRVSDINENVNIMFEVSMGIL